MDVAAEVMFLAQLSRHGDDLLHRVIGIADDAGGEEQTFDVIAAVEIQRQALELGLLNKPCELQAIPSADYPTPARRPVYSVLDRSRLLGAGMSAGLSTGSSEGENSEISTADGAQRAWQAQLTLVLTALAADNTPWVNC